MTLSRGESESTGEETLASRAVRGGLWVALSSGWTVLFGFAINLVLTRILAPEAFGVFSLASFFFAVINVRHKVVVGPAFGQRREMTGELIGTHLALDLAAGLATLVLAVLCLWVLPAFGYAGDVGQVVLALSLIGVADAITGTAWVLLDRELRFRQTSVVSGITFPLSYVPAVYLALRGAGYWSLVAQAATYSVLLLGGTWWAAKRTLPDLMRLRLRFDRKVAGYLVRFGALVGGSTVLVMLGTQFDNFLVGTFVSVTTLGFYDRAYRIAQWPATVVSNALGRTALYTYSRLQDDTARLGRTVQMTFWLIAILALPLALAVFAAAPDLVVLLYGVDWLPSAGFLRILVVYAVVRPLLDVAGALFTGVGKPQRATAVWGAQAGTLLIVGTGLTFLLGATGTAIGVGIAFFVGLAVALFWLRRTVACGLWREFGLPAVCAVATIACYLAVTHLVDLSGLATVIRVLAKGCLTAGTYCLFLFAAQPSTMRARVGYIVRLIRGRLPAPAGEMPSQ
ncbi:MAG: oligosaccharide flippase family protein [Anaerolineae bacterium]